MKPGMRVAIVPVALLILSIAANWILYGRARMYYMQLSETRLDPLGLAMGDTTSVPARGSESARVVFLGDSRAFGWRRPPLPQDHLIINRGVGAQTTIQILERFDRQMAGLDPDLIILQAGINDLKLIALFPERKEEIIASCRRNLRELVGRSLATGADVVLVTIFPRGPMSIDRMPFWSDDVDSAVIALNSELATMRAERLAVLDASLLLDDEGYVRAEYAEDLVHLSDAGYEALNGRLMELLATSGSLAIRR
jgi:lysophospholipase L1-like esterase